MQDEANPWEAANIPEWVPLLDVPGWVEKVFGHNARVVIPQLLRGLKTGSFIVHKVVGLEAISSPGRPSLPAGYRRLERAAITGRAVIVTSWDDVGFDPATGTVSGRHRGDRHILVLWWLSVERWERMVRPTLQRGAASVSSIATTPSPNEPEPPPSDSSPSRAPSRKSGLDYRSSDLPLIEAMREMIRRGEASGANDAAKAFADQAKGTKNSDSKRKRLLKLYKEQFPA